MSRNEKSLKSTGVTLGSFFYITHVIRGLLPGHSGNTLVRSTASHSHA